MVLPGLLSAVAVRLFALVFVLIAELAAIAMLVARAEGRSISIARAYSDAVQRWPRAVRFNFYAGLQVAALWLACVFPGLWRSILLSLTNVVSFVKPIDSEPLRESEQLATTRLWEYGGFIAFAWLGMMMPWFGFDAVFYVLLRHVHRPPVLSLLLGGVLAVGSKTLLQAFLVSAYYGLNASAGKPPPISPDLSRTP